MGNVGTTVDVTDPQYGVVTEQRWNLGDLRVRIVE